MNHDGRDAPSSPETIVRSIVSVDRRTSAPAGSIVAIRRSTIWPFTCRNAIASPRGDQDGDQEWPSLVILATSPPVAASRTTMSVPNGPVFVAATYLPSGDQAGAR